MGEAKLIYYYEAWHRGSGGRKKRLLALPTYWMVPNVDGDIDSLNYDNDDDNDY